MSLLYAGFNGFNQWPTEDTMTTDFQNTNIEKYLKIPETIEQFDWSVEWAYNAYILNSKCIILKGFNDNTIGETIVLNHPQNIEFTSLSCNDKYLLLYNYKDKYVWKYTLDPDVEEKWKLLPNFLNSESELKTCDKVELNNETILKIACGVMINVCITSHGRLFNIPSEISTENISGKIIDVCCGYEHAILLTDQGNVYTMGGGSRCQLGNGSIDSSDLPQLVNALAGIEIVKISAGGWHSCAISNIGDLYTWGWNDRGQLGINSQPENSFVDSTTKKSERIDDTEMQDSSFQDCFDDEETNDAQTNDFNSWVDSDKQLEFAKRSRSDDGEQSKRIKTEDDAKDVSSFAIPNLIDIYDSTNGKILELNIVDVSCGSKHTVIKLDDGSIWGTGCNKYGQLGFNSEVVENVNHYTMLKVKAKNAILKCGIWATTLFTNQTI